MASIARSGRCANCDIPTTRNCLACLGAPAYNGAVVVPSFYCSPNCRTSHRISHQAECRTLQLRRMLQRAATLLQGVMLRIKKHGSAFLFTSIRVEGSEITYQVLPNHPDLGLPIPFTLGSRWDGDERYLHPALLYLSCTEGLIYLPEFVRALLKDICIDIRETTIYATNPVIRLKIEGPDGRRFDNISDPCAHNVFGVKLRSGETWMIDPTGATFGFETLYPWAEYIEKHTRSIGEYHLFESALGSSRRGGSRFHPVLFEKLERLAKKLDNKIPQFASEYGGRLSAILEGVEETFLEAKERFLDQIDDEVRAHTEGIVADFWSREMEEQKESVRRPSTG